ncbi:TIR protein [Candidatus Magnetomorum sp. HK-1]|nr:TIR protein [Candidatus Magnetomorum sp. HK-1]
MERNKKTSVFISYAREDEKIALKMYNDLKDRNIDAWIDKKNIKPGENWKNKIKQSIKKSSYFLALLSSNSTDKEGFIQNELKIALNLLDEKPVSEIFIIPVRVNDCNVIEDKIQNLHWVDLFSDYKSGFNKILEVLESKANNKSVKRWSEFKEDSFLELKLPIFQWDKNKSSPGALLRADCSCAVPFHFREQEMKDIENWVVSDFRLALRLYIGAGGRGKTRLFIEACKKLQQKGWNAGFLDFENIDILNDVFNKMKIKYEKGCVIIIDYAGTKEKLLFAILEEALKAGDYKIRIVLLDRSLGQKWEFWKSKRSIYRLLCKGAAERKRLPPVADTVETRKKSFDIALKHFSNIFMTTFSESYSEDLDAEYYNEILFLQFRALCAIEGVLIEGDQGLLNHIISRERRFWYENAEEIGLELTDSIINGISQAAAASTLVGGIEKIQDAIKLFKIIPYLKDQPDSIIFKISKLLHEIYPGRYWINPIKPDILGDHLVRTESNRSPILLSEIPSFYCHE